MDINSLGDILEANGRYRLSNGRAAPDLTTRYDVHNSGHGVLANLSPAQRFRLPDGELSRPFSGMMGNPARAPQDHIFWQWHRHIDNLAEAWRKKAGEQVLETPERLIVRNDLNGGDRPLESPDIIFMTYDALRDNGINPDTVTSAELDAFGREHFGGDNWDTDFQSAEAPRTTGTFRTFCLEGVFRTTEQDNPNASFRRQHLNHDRFATFIRVQNGNVEDDLDEVEDKQIALRLFLVPETRLNERPAWIEMDCIPIVCPPGRHVFARLGQQASVVRKRDGRAPWPYSFGTYDEHRQQQLVDIPGATDESDFCECGWPFNLYLPRGTAQGLPFVYMAMVTEGDAAEMQRTGQCGSRSFCGVRDQDYPDLKPMGYPFNQPFVGELQDPPVADAISRAILEQPNIAARRVIIQHDGLQILRPLGA